MKAIFNVCKKFVKMCASVKKVDPNNPPPDGTPIVSLRKNDKGKREVRFYRQGDKEELSLKDAFIRDVKKNITGEL